MNPRIWRKLGLSSFFSYYCGSRYKHGYRKELVLCCGQSAALLLLCRNSCILSLMWTYSLSYSWSHLLDLNQGASDYKSDALPDWAKVAAISICSNWDHLLFCGACILFFVCDAFLYLCHRISFGRESGIFFPLGFCCIFVAGCRSYYHTHTI